MLTRGSGPPALVVALAAGLTLAALPGIVQTRPASLTTVSPDQATPAETLEPTEVPPTPEPAPETPEPPERCLSGVASPRFFWTVYAAPRLSPGVTGMWVPAGDHGGPYLKAYVKALYGNTWYGATIDSGDGVVRPDPYPAWPRPDIVRSASAGVQTTRVGNPMCGRTADSALPPCYAELVYPLVFLDRLAPDGPYLRKTYFWLPSDQVTIDEGRPSRVTAQEYSATACETRRIGVRLPRSRPVYANFSGCSQASQRIDTCYLAGCGDLWLHCQ